MVPQSRLSAHRALQHSYLEVSHDDELLFDMDERRVYEAVVAALPASNVDSSTCL